MTALTPPPLYVVADLDFVGDTERWLQCLTALDALGKQEPSVLAIQIRAKGRTETELTAVARLARQAVTHVPLVLNGSSRLAAQLGYDGVHWPAASLSALEDIATDTIGNLTIRTAAIHSASAVPNAERARATALVFAPVYAPRWKAVPAAGLDALRDAVATTALPVYALGGVTPERVGACVEAGAHGVAVLSGVMGSAAPAADAARYVDALASWRSSRQQPLEITAGGHSTPGRRQ